LNASENERNKRHEEIKKQKTKINRNIYSAERQKDEIEMKIKGK